jgi:hypothetical protein
LGKIKHTQVTVERPSPEILDRRTAGGRKHKFSGYMEQNYRKTDMLWRAKMYQ